MRETGRGGELGTGGTLARVVSVIAVVCAKVLDTADIVRDAIYRHLRRFAEITVETFRGK